MIYECEECGSTLTAGILACSKCGQVFDEAVPQDAEAPKRGWQSKSLTTSSLPSVQLTASAPSSATASPPEVGQSSSNNSDREYWQNKAKQIERQLGKATQAALASSYIKRLKQKPLFFGIGFVALILLFVVLVRPHTNAYVFDQHPMYQANMASFTDVARSHQIDYTWPYEGHEDRLGIVYHPYSYGSNSSQLPSKHDLDIAAITGRLGFCAIRYRSGFTPEEAMRCQAHVTFDGSSDTGYDGPEVAPDRDAAMKDRLDQVR